LEPDKVTLVAPPNVRLHVTAKPDNPADKKRRRAMLFLGGLLLAYLAFRLCLSGYLDHQVRQIRASGDPVSLDDLNDWYTAPSGENAADTYAKAIAPFLDEDTGGEGRSFRKDIPSPTDLRPIDPELIKRLDDFTSRHKDAIEYAQIAAEIADCRFPVDYRQLATLNLESGHQFGLTLLAQLLSYDCIVALEQGDAERAIRDVRLCASASLALGQEPSMSAFFSQQIIQKTAVDSLQRTLLRVQVDSASLAELQRAFEAAYAAQDIRRAIRGERAQEFVRFMVPLGRRQAVINRNEDMFPLFTLPGFGDLMDLECARYMYHTNKLAGYADAVYEGEGLRHDIVYFNSPIASPALPPPDFLKRNYGIHRARLASAISGIAIARYNLAHGEPPNALADLVPKYLAAVPKDPFRRGYSMNYIRFSKRGFVVYSVGENILDDGGRDVKVMTHLRRTAGQAERRVWPGDISFRVED
jgi:hypothetical protein